MLRRLGLEFPARAQIGQEGDVDVEDIFTSDIIAQLADRFQKRLALDIAHRPADLHQRDIRLQLARGLHNALLDLRGHVRHHLDRAAQVIAPPLLGDYLAVHLARSEVVELAQILVNKTLVVS